MEENRRLLADRFAARLFTLAPSSVLDLGCGRGGLVRACLEQGIPSKGIEASPEAVSEARAADLPVHEGDITELDAADGSFDWLTLRHVLHHLEKPARALNEAWRVARAGLLVAEPFYDTAIPSQRTASEIDRLLKRLDHRRGAYHADVLSSQDVLALLPPAAQVILETHLCLRPYRAEAFKRELERSSQGLELTEQEREERDALLEDLEKGEVTLNGTLILTVRKG